MVRPCILIAFKGRSIVTVNQWLLVSIQCQRECPIQSAVKKESLFSSYSSIVILHICENNTDAKWPSNKLALGQGPCLAIQFCSAPLGFTLLYSGKRSLVVQLQPRKGRPQSLVERESAHSKQDES